MSADALRSPVVLKVREEVPEFEASFQAALLGEDGELGSFQAMSTFAGWLVERLRTDPLAPEVVRSFAVVESVATSGQFPMGRALVTEFVEALGSDEEAIRRLGPASGAYLGWS